MIKEREPSIRFAALEMHQRSLAAATTLYRASVEPLTRRDSNISAAVPSTARELIQVGLFDGRALKALGARRRAAGTLLEKSQERLAATARNNALTIRVELDRPSHPPPGHPMIAGLSGSLLSHEGVADDPQLVATDDEAAMPRRRLQTWIGAVLRTMGPASSARAVYDRVAVPLFSELGFRTILTRADTDAVLRGVLHAGGLQAAVVLVTAWGREPGAAWRDAVLLGIGKGVRWCLCVNGPVVRVFDSRRTYSRRFVQFDLEVTIGHPDSFKLFWHLLQATAFSAAVPRLDRAVRISEEHRSDVRVSLQRGVHDALERLVSAFARAHGRRALPPADVLFDESLTVLYRILFLLFAEARGLVPKWHPTYGDSYTIESLRLPIERQLRPKGVWEALQAISRLAHKGCRAGTLRVAPFNGRLFSPSEAPLASSVALDDGAVREVLLALTTRAGREGRRRIAYGDLGVEQLGGVYERILDFAPEWVPGTRGSLTLVPAGKRKASGAFYTPRSLTEYVVRRTLAPLVREASPDRILALRVLDPAMGSGAFLVAACRYPGGVLRGGPHS